MSYIPDPIEQMEDSAERWYFENSRSDGKVVCPECSEAFHISHMAPLTMDGASLACEACCIKITGRSPFGENPDASDPL